MDAKRLITEFRYIASARGGVQQLRELIIYLAIHGELNTGRESNRDAAQKLIDEAAIVQNKLTRARKRSREQQLPVVPESYVAKYPETWIPTRLGCLVHLVSGQHLSEEDQNFNRVGIPYFTGASDFGALHPIVTRWTSVGRAIAIENDVLIAVKGTIGKVNLLNLERAAIGRQLMAVRALTIDPAFLVLVLRSNERFLCEKGVGIAIPGISRIDLLHLIVGIPSRDQQERIVAKVDQLMALCNQLEAQQQEREALSKLTRTVALDALIGAQSSDALRSAWRRVQRNISLLFTQSTDVADLRAAILDLAATGRLSQSQAEDTPVAAWLEEVKASRYNFNGNNDSKPRRPTPTSLKDVDIPVPAYWGKARIDDLFQFIDYRGRTPIKTTSGRILVTAKNVRPGRIEPNPVEYVSETGYHEWMTRGFPKAGDLLITTEAPLGNVARIEEAPQFALAQRVIDLQPYASINTKFFMFFMMSPSFQRLLWANATGITARGIKAAKLKQLRLSVPPPEEQKRIVQCVEGLLAICDQLETQLTMATFVAEHLARGCTAAITGIQIEEEKRMKAPKTELVSNLRVGITPTSQDQAKLAAILIRNNGELPARTLWIASGLKIDAFYQQVKTEMAEGWIMQPNVAYMKEVEAG